MVGSKLGKLTLGRDDESSSLKTCDQLTQILIWRISHWMHCQPFQRVDCSARMAGTAAPAVFDDLILHIAPDKFYLESLSSTQSVLVIDRITYEISLQVKL